MRFSFVCVCLLTAAWAAPTPPPPDNPVPVSEIGRQQLLTEKPWTRYRSKVKRNSEKEPIPQQIPLPPVGDPELVRQWIQEQELKESTDQPGTANAPDSQILPPQSVVDGELPLKARDNQEVSPESGTTRPRLEVSDLQIGSQEQVTNHDSPTVEIPDNQELTPSEGGRGGYRLPERIRQVRNNVQNRFDSVGRNAQRLVPEMAEKRRPGEKPRGWIWDTFRDGVGQQLRRFQPGHGSSSKPTTESAPPSGGRQPWYKQWVGGLSKFVNRDGPNPQPEVKAPDPVEVVKQVEAGKPFEDWLAKREPWVDEVMKVTNWEPTRLDRYHNELDLINDIVTPKYSGAKWTKEFNKCKEELVSFFFFFGGRLHPKHPFIELMYLFLSK